MTDNHRARILATGMYVPKRVLTNRDLEEMVDTSDEWIVSRTGMKERRIASDEEPPSKMGEWAVAQALERAGVQPADVDLIIAATMTPDYMGAPNTASLIQTHLGCESAGALDLNAACSGYIYALTVAKGMVESGIHKTVVVVATEKMSSLGDYSDRTTCILWGDGAAAAVVAREGAGLRLDAVSVGADGSLARLLQVPAGGSLCPPNEQTVRDRLHFIRMQGRETFKHAVRHMEAVGRSCLDEAGVSSEDLSWVVPHQANMRIIDAVSSRFGISDEKVYKTVQKYGNSSASAVGLALDELMTERPVGVGEHILLIAFGAGLTWAGALCTRVSE